MNLKLQAISVSASRRRRLDSVALVITLLMLSVITFLAIAFLAMSRRNQSSVIASLDTTTAQSMSQAAQARAIAEIMAQIVGSGDALQYDYMVSRNAINPRGFNNASNKVFNSGNVNYDYLYSPSGAYLPFNNATDPLGWVQNIANLWYDPRPPVFVVTNPAYPNNYDFRFWVDLNRNGRFETNGYQITYPIEPPHGQLPLTGPAAVLNGEPEWIGLLKNPLQHHSSTNQFIGRYAYLVLPIGKTLDFNYIHNFLKAIYAGGAGGVFAGNILTNTSIPGNENDGFARDQGVGSWEMNLAGLLDAISPWGYESNHVGYAGFLNASTGPYTYLSPALSDDIANKGWAFDDAEAILHYRYMPPAYKLNSLFGNFPSSYLDDYNNFIDIFCAAAPLEAPFDYNETNVPLAKGKYIISAQQEPWPGSYGTNMFFDPQDLFDPNKTSFNFSNRLILASQRTNTSDRYTFERLLSCIGMGSSPEYGVWVYGDYDLPGHPNQLRTKININYDNTSQMTNVNAPFAPMPTNLVSWKPATFFNNAAELMLRSQGFWYSNYLTNVFTIYQLHFGVTNIPIYSASNPGIHYDAAVHRVLQLAANIYDATNPTNEFNNVSGYTAVPVRHPTVFRPLFQVGYFPPNAPSPTNYAVYITGYVQVTNALLALQQMELPFQDLTNVTPATFHTNWNVAGVPWIVAANKGLPAFYRYTAGSQVMLERKLLFPRAIVNGVVQTNLPPVTTNQFFCMAVTNCLGVDGWNPYPYPFGGSNGILYYYYSNYVTVELTNGFNYGTNIIIGTNNFYIGGNAVSPWKAGGGPVKSTSGFLPIFNNTNVISLPESYYSESLHGFYYLTNGDSATNSWRSTDLSQKSWPVYNWTINVSNHIIYALFDGPPNNGGALLDFVNLGPFGSTINLTNAIYTLASQNNGLGVNGGSNPGIYWSPGAATSLPTSPMSLGVINQINEAENIDPTWALNLIGKGSAPDPVLGCPFNPSWIIQQPTNWVANDPLVHYTLEDMTWLGSINSALVGYDISHGDVGPLLPPTTLIPPLSNSVGTVSSRYGPWGANDTIHNNMLFKDPLIAASVDWNFPTNKFPGIGWIGRVHRGTPWQTVFLKADVEGPTEWSKWAALSNPNYINTTIAPETYPTNDYPYLDVFTTAPNDNAACGLLSVNQTNDPAWAAVFAGVIALTNGYGGTPIMPNANSGYLSSFTNLMDGPYGINAQRTNQPNGIFHKVGYILAAPALSVNSPFLPTDSSDIATLTDEAVERIPQQTLSLLKVGEPQFVIFAWGQALKPKGPPYLGLGPNANIYTNYEITGEYLTRTVCHLVHTNGYKMVIDSYNTESGNN